MKRSESNAGFHFIETYASCPMKSFFRYILKWIPQFKSPALSFGGCIHEAKAQFYLEDKDPIGVFEKEMKACQMLYEDQDRFSEDLNRGAKMLNCWMCTYGMNWKDEYEPLEIDGELSIEMPFSINIGDEEYPIEFTGRWDAVFRQKNSGLIIIEEAKTSSYSLDKAYENLYYSHQPSAYIYAWNKLHPDIPVEGVLPDILYARKNGPPKCERFPLIYRTKKQLENFRLSMLGYASEITQKAKSLADFPYIQLFTQRPTCDGDGSWTCDYRHLCWDNPDFALDHPPFGYVKEEEDDEIKN